MFCFFRYIFCPILRWTISNYRNNRLLHKNLFTIEVRIALFSYKRFHCQRLVLCKIIDDHSKMCVFPRDGFRSDTMYPSSNHCHTSTQYSDFLQCNTNFFVLHRTCAFLHPTTPL